MSLRTNAQVASDYADMLEVAYRRVKADYAALEVEIRGVRADYVASVKFNRELVNEMGGLENENRCVWADNRALVNEMRELEAQVAAMRGKVAAMEEAQAMTPATSPFATLLAGFRTAFGCSSLCALQ